MKESKAVVSEAKNRKQEKELKLEYKQRVLFSKGQEKRQKDLEVKRN